MCGRRASSWESTIRATPPGSTKRRRPSGARGTSTEPAPWYVIPADHKWFMRTAVAAILVHHLEAMDPRFPTLSSADRAAMREAVAALEAEQTQ